MASDFSQLTEKVDRLNRLVSGGELRRISERVGAKSKTVAIGAVDPNTLGRWGKGARKGGYTVKARYTLKSDHEVQVAPTMAPLAALLELGSYKAGGTWKAPKRRGSARRKKGTAGSYSRAGVPARHAWSKASNELESKAPGFVHDEVVRVIGSVF